MFTLLRLLRGALADNAVPESERTLRMIHDHRNSQLQNRQAKQIRDEQIAFVAGEIHRLGLSAQTAGSMNSAGWSMSLSTGYYRDVRLSKKELGEALSFAPQRSHLPDRRLQAGHHVYLDDHSLGELALPKGDYFVQGWNGEYLLVAHAKIAEDGTVWPDGGTISVPHSKEGLFELIQPPVWNRPPWEPPLDAATKEARRIERLRTRHMRQVREEQIAYVAAEIGRLSLSEAETDRANAAGWDMDLSTGRYTGVRLTSSELDRAREIAPHRTHRPRRRAQAGHYLHLPYDKRKRLNVDTGVFIALGWDGEDLLVVRAREEADGVRVAVGQEIRVPHPLHHLFVVLTTPEKDLAAVQAPPEEQSLTHRRYWE